MTTDLTAEQARACASDEDRVLVIAGAGSGKTRELTARIVRALDENVRPERILAVTFTNRAADDMRRRIGEATGGVVPEVRTLHAWCATFLRAHAGLISRTPRFAILDEDDAVALLRDAARRMGRPNAETAEPETLRADALVAARYASLLRTYNSVDFDMLEAETVRLLRTMEDVREDVASVYDLVLVDEYQDTNLSQVFILNTLDTTIHMVGDPRQAIYRFRGAEVRTIVELARGLDVDVHELTTCYRCSADVVALANDLMPAWTPLAAVHAAGTVHAAVYDLEPAGVVDQVRRIRRDHWEESAAVLVRTWEEGEHAVRALRSAGLQATLLRKTTDAWGGDVARQLVRAVQLMLDSSNDWLASMLADWGREAFPRYVAADLRAAATRDRSSVYTILVSDDYRSRSETGWHAVVEAHLRLHVKGGKITAHAVARTVVEGLGLVERLKAAGRLAAAETLTEVLLPDLERRGLAAHELGAWWALRSHADRAKPAEGVHVLTVHAAKGLEYDHVIVAGAMAGAYPTDRAGATEDDREEDMRLLYVAATRAKHTLALVRPSWRTPRWGEPSPSAAPPRTERVSWAKPAAPDWGGSTPWGA